MRWRSQPGGIKSLKQVPLAHTPVQLRLGLYMHKCTQPLLLSVYVCSHTPCVFISMYLTCVLVCLCVSVCADFPNIAGQEALLLEHAPLFLPAFSPNVPGFPRFQELYGGRQWGSLTLTLITKRSQLGVRPLSPWDILLSCPICLAQRGLFGSLKMILPSGPGLDIISFNSAHLGTCILVANVLQPALLVIPQGSNKSPW